MQRNKYFIVLLLLFSFKIKAQVSVSDSIFLNSIFTEPLYNSPSLFPGTWYLNNSITTVSDLYNSINNEFKFFDSEFPNCYENISIPNNMVKDNLVNPTMNYYFNNFGNAYKQIDPIYYLNFSLNNKTTKSYFTFTPKALNSSDSVAFLIIPGSNNNQTTDLIVGTGYHNINCYVKDYLKNIGDTYIYTKPGEDFRAWIRNNQKLNTADYVTPGAASFLYNYLNSNNKPYGINYLIESIALIKYLNTKYKKVILLGCSQGGYATLLTALNATIDASIISSGYSINFDNSPNDIYSLQQNFGSLTPSLPDTAVKLGIKKSNAEFLFSWPNLDSYWYQLEHDSQPTQNYFTGLSNCNYYYNYTYHSFPQCANLDTFINRVLLKPKPFVKIIDSICTADSVVCAVTFTGTPPFTFDLYKDSIYFNSYSTNTKSINISIFQNGIYQIKNLEDGGPQPGFKSDFFTIQKNKKINFTLLNKSFDCDSQKTKLSLKFNGTSPWNLNYNVNGSNFNLISHDSLKSLYTLNGNVSFNSVTDSNLCFKAFNTALNINEFPVNISFSSPQYICDSNKTAIPFSLSGKAPWKIQYKKNNIPFTIITSSNNYSLLLSNGNYFFENISDSNNCTKTINQIFNINFQPLSYTITNPIYNCDSNKSKINFTFNGNPPYIVYFRRNNTPQSFTTSLSTIDRYFINGYYIFDSIKDATCLKKISPAIQHNFYYPVVNFSASSPTYICDSNKAKINFTLQGNPPFTVLYTKNGVVNQFTTSLYNTDIMFTNGIYNFSKITDGNQCNLNFNILKNIDFDSLGIQMSTPIYNCDSNKSKIQFTFTGNSPWTVYYKKNNVPFFFTSTNTSIEAYFGNGNYSFDSVKDASCVKKIAPSIQHTFNYTPTSTSVSTPFYNCDSNKSLIQFACQGNSPYTVYYTQNGILNQFTTSTSFTNKLFNNGLYYFIESVDNLNCIAPINQVRNINYQTINYAITNLGYSCDSNKNKLNFTLTGNSPWTIFYRKNNIPQSISTGTVNSDFYFSNGIYSFDSIKDATCTKPILSNNQFNFNYNPITVSAQNPIYNCDSNKAFINFNFTGNPPYTLNYTKDGIINNITTTSNNFNQSFSNGFYYFIKVTDNTNCQKSLNILNNIQYSPLDYSIDAPEFICDSVKTKFHFHFQGNAPWTVFYRKNNLQYSFTTSNPNHAILTTNGTFNFDSLKDASCSKLMNPMLSYNINNSLLNVIMDTPIYDCNVNKVKVHFEFQGNAPWKIHYFKIGVPNVYNSFTTYSNIYDAYFSTGNYIIDSITDNSNCTKVYNTYVYNNYSPIGCVKTATTFNCDSNKTQLQYQLFGDAPWTITYRNIDSNIIIQKQTNSNHFNLFLKNGNYVIQSIADYKCSKIINDTLHFNVPKLTSTISAEAISCDSNKMYVIIQATSGNPPYYYKYYKNNILQTKISYLNTDTFYLNNGAYFFERMTDSIGCEVIFNKNVVVEYNPFYFNNITNKYNCEKDSTLVKFDINNYNDVYLQYTKNNSSISSLTIDFKNQEFYFPNGNYHWINLIDSIGCIKSIDQYLEINNEPININKDSIVKDCENREYVYQLSFDGKSPWKINYNKNNILQTETFFNENNQWTIPAGKYYFINVTDSNLCTMDILRQDTLIQFLNQNPVITYSNNRIIATQIPYNYTWYKDNVIIPNEKNNVITPYGNGIYAASVIDSAGCIYYSNNINLNFPEDINLYPNPSSDKVNITVNANYGDYWEYTLYDMFGNQIAQDIVSLPYKEINVSHLARGVYHFIIKFSTGFETDKKVIRFMKN